MNRVARAATFVAFLRPLRCEMIKTVTTLVVRVEVSFTLRQHAHSLLVEYKLLLCNDRTVNDVSKGLNYKGQIEMTSLNEVAVIVVGFTVRDENQ